jgi:hypothetical protein
MGELIGWLIVGLAAGVAMLIVLRRPAPGDRLAGGAGRRCGRGILGGWAGDLPTPRPRAGSAASCWLIARPHPLRPRRLPPLRRRRTAQHTQAAPAPSRDGQRAGIGGWIATQADRPPEGTGRRAV